jgi:hypothetical protein
VIHSNPRVRFSNSRVPWRSTLAGDSVEAWLPPLVFLTFVIVSWALRPAGRRLPNAGLASETRPLARAVPIGILLLLFVVSYLTLPAVNQPSTSGHVISAGLRAESDDEAVSGTMCRRDVETFGGAAAFAAPPQCRGLDTDRLSH